MAIVGIYGVVVLGSALYGTPKIAELREQVDIRLAGLEQGRETDRQVLALVRREIAEILGRLNALEARQAE